MEMHLKNNVEPERLEEAIKTVQETGEYNYFVTQELENGKRVLSSRVSCMLDPTGKLVGYVLFSQDVTEQVLAEEALQESETKYRLIAENTIDFIFQMDLKMKFIYMSPSLHDVLGWYPEEVIGTRLFRYTSRKEFIKIARIAINTVRRYKTGNKALFESKLLNKNGKEIPVEISGKVLLNEKGKPIGIQGNVRDITERKKAEEALTEGENNLRALINTMTDIVFEMDYDGRYVNIAPTSTDFMFKPAVEAIGKTLHEVFPKPQADIFLEFIRKCLDENVINTIEYPLIIDDKKIWFEGRATPKTKNSVLYIARDITERKRTEQIQKVLYNISNAVITTDNLKKLISLIQEELGTIIDTTDFYVALYDHKTDTLSLPFFADEKDELTSLPVGKTLTNYVIKTQNPLLATKEKLKALEQSGVIDSFDSDSEIWLGVPLKVEGKITGVLAVQSYTDENAFDESDLKILEFVSDQISISIERKKAEQDLINALEKATESDRLKSAFLATLSHELRTPLNAIIGFSDLIDEELSVEKIISYTKTINSSGKHLLSLVENLFDIILIESGKTKIVKEDFKLQSILNNVQIIIHAEQQKTSKENINLNLINPPEGRDLTINTDRFKLKQILINLLKNALKFTHEGHINYGYSITTDRGKPMLKFYVEDTGIGIPEGKQELIFDFFRQVDDSHTRRYGGTGIGLSIAKKLTELLGGKIWLESEKGKGSTFYFTIPFDEFKKISKPIIDETKKKN